MRRSASLAISSARIIAATHVDLGAAIIERRFREDLTAVQNADGRR
jgi:DNA-binding NtrC family response regulator